jgi:acetolactate synthase-1/2/3 large subunit
VLIEFSRSSTRPSQAERAALSNWWKQIDEWRGRDCLKFPTSDLASSRNRWWKSVEVTKGDAFITSDVGQHQMWARSTTFDKPRRWINSGGLGTMGVGLPYAMGVQMANPDATVACITGEGSIQMCIQELPPASSIT